MIASLNTQKSKKDAIFSIPPRERIDMVGKTVRTSDRQDLGNVESIGNEVIVVRRILLSFVHLHHYYIPFVEVQGYDGNMVLLKISRDQVEKRYASHDPPPKRALAKNNTKAVL